MPVPLAAGLYGVLLGLGFTTFILSFAVWALAGVAVALGDPQLGLAIGLGFGAGRTLPVIALAPFGGGRLHAAMAEQPRILRSLRLVDAAALTVARRRALRRSRPGRGDRDRRSASPTRCSTAPRSPCTGPAASARSAARTARARCPATTPRSAAAARPGSTPTGIVVSGAATFAVTGADAIAVSASYVAWRAGRTLNVASLDPATGYAARTVLTGNVGRPALSGNLLVFDVDGRIESIDLATGVHSLLRRQARAQLRGPSVFGTELAYVIATKSRQQVRIGPLRPQRPSSDEALYGTWPSARRDAGHEAGRFPAKGHINKPLWERPPEDVDDTLTTTAADAPGGLLHPPAQAPRAAGRARGDPGRSRDRAPVRLAPALRG